MRRFVEFLALLVFDTTPSTCCVCYPSVAGFGMVWQTQSRAGSTLGFSCSQLQLRSSLWCRSQSLSMTGPSLPLLLLWSRALRRQTCSAGSLRRDVVWWWFYCRWYLRFCMGQCEADDWKFFLFPVPEVVGRVCMLNGWFSSNDEVCADFYIYFRFKLKDMLCSGSCICTTICLSRWTVIAWKCCPGGVPPLRFFTLGNGSHTICAVPAF